MDKPLPIVEELNRPYWDAAREGRLLLQHCTTCGLFQFYPRPSCLRCSSGDLEWKGASGNGRLHTFSVVQRTADRAFADDVPYVFGVVELEEGPRVTVNVVDTPLDQLRCDLPVRMVFTELGPDVSIPNARATDR